MKLEKTCTTKFAETKTESTSQFTPAHSALNWDNSINSAWNLKEPSPARTAIIRQVPSQEALVCGSPIWTKKNENLISFYFENVQEMAPQCAFFYFI